MRDLQPFVAGFMVVATRDDGSRHYMAIDYSSGGHEYWSSALSGAAFYASEDEATADLAKRQHGGVFLHSASGADFSKPERTVRIGVERLDAVPLFSIEYPFRISGEK